MRARHERVNSGVAGRARRVMASVSSHPVLAGRLGLALALGLGLLLMVVVILPALVLGLLGLAAFGVVRRGRALVARVRGRSGVLNGRRNVRVIERG